MIPRSKGWWVASTTYAVLVAIASLIPIGPQLTPPGQLDKVVHLCEYLIFAWLLTQAFSSLEYLDHPLAAAWVIAVVYGSVLELLQAFVPWRSAELADALMNAVGAGMGIWIERLFPHPFQEDRRRR